MCQHGGLNVYPDTRHHREVAHSHKLVGQVNFTKIPFNLVVWVLIGSSDLIILIVLPVFRQQRICAVEILAALLFKSETENDIDREVTLLIGDCFQNCGNYWRVPFD
jgi:hypothetical protein